MNPEDMKKFLNSMRVSKEEIKNQIGKNPREVTYYI